MTFYHINRIRGVFLALLLLSVSFGTVQANSESFTLDNGMQVILKENHNSPMVATVIFVRSGAKYESPWENGITHFLEHLLFDGTANMSREQLDASISDLGGYINAFTRKDLTAYLVLLPKQYIDYGMTVQADMLFNSVFPEEELPKERKVVIEEIHRDNDAPGAAADAFFTQHAYAGTEYARPVLGYEPFIANIPRDAIIQYWKTYYIPKNMTTLVIGDFDSDSMKTMVTGIFGRFTNPTPDTTAVPEEKTLPVPLTGQNVFDTVANVQATHINFSIAAPLVSDSDYLAFDLLTQYLALDDVSPLMTYLTGGAEPLATDVGLSLDAHDDLSRLDISVVTPNATNRDTVIATVLGHLKAAADLAADPEALGGIKTSVKCSYIYNADKLHYYGFIIAPMIMTAGWNFVQSYPDMLAKVQWQDCRKAAARWLTSPSYVATVVRPIADSSRTPYTPPTLTEEEVTAHFASVTFPTYDLKTGHELTYPETDSVSFELTDRAQYKRELLDNGLTLIVKSSPDSRVFAVNVLGKNRSANEPDSLAGITDFVNRCLEQGTMSRSASQLSRDLAAIGANVTLYDNPWIPYDDRYTTREFSFFKFETIDEFAKRGVGLLLDMLLYPAFDSSEVENVRTSMLSVIGRNAASTRDVARDLFYRLMFQGTPFAKSITGTPETIRSITIADLKAYHDRYYSPTNIIVTVSTERPAGEVISWFKETLGRLALVSMDTPEVPEPDLGIETRTDHVDLDKQQVYLYLGSTLPGANSPDAAAIQVAVSILSDRLYLKLREKQGLAYSVGAGATLDRNFGWYYCAMGTGSENYQTALDGMKLEIQKLKLDGPTPAEINRARNQIWGHLMSAKLSRINQAYYLGVNEYLGRDVNYDSEFLKALADVNVESIRRVVGRYFRDTGYVLATAGKKQ